MITENNPICQRPMKEKPQKMFCLVLFLKIIAKKDRRVDETINISVNDASASRNSASAQTWFSNTSRIYLASLFCTWKWLFSNSFSKSFSFQVMIDWWWKHMDAKKEHTDVRVGCLLAFSTWAFILRTVLWFLTWVRSTRSNTKAYPRHIDNRL